ncbi:MAG: ABC transporter permease [Gammaproteobacteria bacterium]|nr:ABC transporter permease [Gammaproteobacteria bacterium]
MSTKQTIIQPGRTARGFLLELVEYRDLFFFLAWRDILVRYKQTVIGIAWSVLRPVLTMVVFVIVFGKIAKLPSDGAPYALLVFAAMLPWQFFANTVTESSNSLIANAQMVSKVYFPRIIIPTTAMVVSLVDFAIAFVLLLGLMLWYGVWPDVRFLILPLLLVLAMITSLGIGYLISALSVKYRDFRYVVPFMVQFGLYVSPVGFSSSVIPEQWRLVYSLNPMVGVIDGFRWAILGGDTLIYWPGFLLSIGIGIGLFLYGVRYFLRSERVFADVI